MEKEHHIHDDDEEEICDQRKSRTARQALEEVRVIILHVNIIRSPNAFPYSCIVFLPAVYERERRGLGTMSVQEKQRFISRNREQKNASA
jgi:hypothetical protein